MAHKHQKRTLAHHWRLWPYKNTTLLLLGLATFILLTRLPAIDEAIKSVGSLGYFGAFITGIFFVSTFTAVPAAYVLFNLAESLHPLEVALLAGAGAMIGDYIIFRLVKDQVFEELKPAFTKLHKLQHPAVRTLFKTPYFSWLLPVIGAIVIASPLPDEAGVSLLGLSKIRKWQFFVITFALNAIGIFLVVSAARL
ncbi:MAG TPA: hypothetical protein VGE30_00745 [Candidatus Saccharimonadales bacterium]